jgi:hypothetical protein
VDVAAAAGTAHRLGGKFIAERHPTWTAQWPKLTTYSVASVAGVVPIGYVRSDSGANLRNPALVHLASRLASANRPLHDFVATSTTTWSMAAFALCHLFLLLLR